MFKKEKPLTKKLALFICMRRFMVLHLLFSLDHGYVKTSWKFVNYSITSICLLIGTTISFVVTKDVFSTDNLGIAWYVIHQAQYMITLLIISFTKYTFASYFSSFNEIDLKLKFKQKQFVAVQIKIIILLISAIGARIIIGSIYIWVYSNRSLSSVGLLILSFYSILALDITQVLAVIKFYVIYYRMKVLRRIIETEYGKKPATDWNNGIKDNQYDIKSILDLYKDIANNSDNIKPTLDALFAVNLLANLPKLMLVIYDTLTVLKNMTGSEYFVVVLLNIVHINVLMWSPCIVAEMVSAEVDHIKLMLHDILIKRQDEKTCRDIELFLNYMTFRPLKYKIYRVVPVDLTLPLSILSLCTTYVIVIIQFTHLYG